MEYFWLFFNPQILKPVPGLFGLDPRPLVGADKGDLFWDCWQPVDNLLDLVVVVEPGAVKVLFLAQILRQKISFLIWKLHFLYFGSFKFHKYSKINSFLANFLRFLWIINVLGSFLNIFDYFDKKIESIYAFLRILYAGISINTKCKAATLTWSALIRFKAGLRSRPFT